ncbi:MAG: hypothetical protein ABIB43_00345 [archaeon]
MTRKIEEDFSEIIKYLDKMADRLNHLEKNSLEVQQAINQKSDELKRNANAIKEELYHLKRTTNLTKEIIEKQKKIISSMVNDFRGIVKQDSFNQLKEKIDIWGPEKALNKEELKRHI